MATLVPEVDDLEFAENLKRLLRPRPDDDWSADPGLERVLAFLEAKTVWHPKGL